MRPPVPPPVLRCLALLCLLATAPSAQQGTPRSTANPDAGLRGDSSRGVGLRGASSRGISQRTTMRTPARPALVASEPADGQPQPPRTPPAPAPTPAPAPGAAPGTSPGASPGAAGAGAVAAPPKLPARPRTRLLSLADGEVLRVPAFRRDGRWQVLTDAGWQALAADSVRHSVLESDLLATARLRREGLLVRDPQACLDEAAWLARSGLVAESLAWLDELLRRPDTAPGAVALLAELDLPERPALALLGGDGATSLDQLLAAGATAGPSLRELLVQELIPFGARQRNLLEQRLLLQRELDDPAASAFATLALRRLFPGR